MIMKTIIATSPKYGQQFVLVDDEDFEELNKFKWHAKKDHNTFYVRRCIRLKGVLKDILMHRVLINLDSNRKMVVDHINHNGLDNRKENLRLCTFQQNMQNRTSAKNSSSKYLGVCWFKRDKKWTAAIRLDGNRKYLGIFNNEIDAAKAYNKAAIEHFGEYANLNKID